MAGGLVFMLGAVSVTGRGLAALAVQSAVVTAGRKSAPVPSASAGDPWNARWSISEATREAKRVLVRRNETAASLVGDPRFPERVTIAVPLPRGADYTPADALHEVEALLVGSLERDRRAIGALVLTTDERREFVFYTADAAWADRIVADLRQKAAPYELRSRTDRDPRWELYTSFGP